MTQIKENNMINVLEIVLWVLLLFLITLLYPPRVSISSIRCLSLHELLNTLHIYLKLNLSVYIHYTIYYV